MFPQDKLFEEKVAEVAARAGMAQETRGNVMASYRVYNPTDLKVFGLLPAMVSLYGNPDQLDEVNFVFTNEGDFFGELEKKDGRLTPTASAELARMKRPFLDRMKNEEEVLKKNLEGVFGKPVSDSLGLGGCQEKVLRWDSDGISILLSAQDKRYVALRFFPKALVDANGLPPRQSDQEVQKTFKARVVQRPNGDVVLGDVPMVNQGAKNYSLPATIERAMRYAGMKMDLYTLGMAGRHDLGQGFENEGAQGGGARSGRRGGYMGYRYTEVSKEDKETSTRDIEMALNPFLQRAGLQYRKGVPLQLGAVKRWIDDGVPLIWKSYLVADMETLINFQTQTRAQVDPQKWTNEVRKFNKNMGLGDGVGMVRLIVGYNEKTREIAVTDPWGVGYEERWMTFENAYRITLSKDLGRISW